MPETINGHRTFALHEFTGSIRRMFIQHYSSAFWITAELNKLGYYAQYESYFPTLVEKKDGKVVATMNAMIMRDDYQRINKKFKEVTGEPLKDGIKILFMAKVSFSPEKGAL